jgi:hypothetical protein
VTKASTRLFPSVSKPQCFVKLNLPALPSGLEGMKDVPLLEGQSVVMRGVGVGVKKEVEDALEREVNVVELLMVNI